MAQDLSPAQRTLSVGVLGAGTVGSQVIRLLTEQADDFAARSGARLEITGVAVRDVNAPRDFAVPQDLLTDDATAVATGNDLVIELIGGIEPARTLILAAFKAGASVITGNKALIAAHGGQATLRLRLSAPAPRTLSDVEGVTSVRTDGAVTVVSGTGAFAQAVLSRLAQADVVVQSMETHLPGLEEVFLNLTGRALREA